VEVLVTHDGQMADTFSSAYYGNGEKKKHVWNDDLCAAASDHQSYFSDIFKSVKGTMI
jgi:hypothetical protein